MKKVFLLLLIFSQFIFFNAFADDKSGCIEGKIKYLDGAKEVLLKEKYCYLIHQYKVKWCKNKKYLPYDFVIPEHKVIIELDGLQHFQQVGNWKSPQ